ncbi:hypothetical protein NDA10_000584 [Ustilago hordei]|uniref:HTH APSES-type domain-containing protein n=1 Tax=Ustilago hordei TaxID=120017 RepID=I2FQP5_USTHO|nr:uncharacterized protein UHO2_05190 [Ustilago hordei]KAJ1042935.1 hypothetical protein NDA10_000584 [Ustilago hordei]KAJ1571207.1 hypothetical protein NDA12_002617 [Ustilago hordei]KAJ1571453.1 hypothetical protein NDA15_002694 [Ustilago hordei]UTT90097.1 hypothetical protein NDA17_005719 [Ustilago hordei]CCF49238.1 uncharacterized protein UHOR_07633 [Ustilago hordei]
MPLNDSQVSTFQAGTGIARKRGLPYARNDHGSPLQSSQTQSAYNGGINFYISEPRPARLFPTPVHEFRKGKYATTGGDRGFMTVFEYDVRGHTMMIDVDTSFVRFTSITQALGKNKVNFGRLVRTCPALEPHISKLKGGYLSIQGTWLPYDLAKELSRRIAWEIRDHLVPLFGYDFPSSCLRPDSEGFGQLAIGMSQKRARKRHNNGGPHQTSCYGPSLPISVVDGQTVEHKTNARSGSFPHTLQQPPHTATFQYSKSYGLDRPHWHGQEAGVASGTMDGELDPMMWPPTPSVCGTGSGGLQVPSVAQGGQYTSPFMAFQSSPVLSSPPSSNASSASAQSYAASYGLMVPPTVPSSSHGAGNGGGQTCSSAASTAAFDFAHAPSSPDKTKVKSGAERDVSSYENNYISSYGDASNQLASWTESGHASAYMSSSPTPPPPPPAATAQAPTFHFDAWQQQQQPCTASSK